MPIQENQRLFGRNLPRQEKNTKTTLYIHRHIFLNSNTYTNGLQSLRPMQSPPDLNRYCRQYLCTPIQEKHTQKCAGRDIYLTKGLLTLINDFVITIILVNIVNLCQLCPKGKVNIVNIKRKGFPPKLRVWSSR